jgi:hypothetical protein
MEKILENIRTVLNNEKNRIETEYADKLTEMLMKISKTYDISFRQLLRDVSIETEQTIFCLGVNKNQKRCLCRATNEGYCKRHKDQKPVVSVAKTFTVTTQHTHTLPPLFLAGCPVCEETRKRRSVLALDI